MINIPTISQLYNGILADLETQYNNTISPVGKSFLRALAAVQAGKLKLYYLAIANLQKQMGPDTADPESIGGTLERYGRIKIGRDPFQATAAQYAVVVTGTIGGVIPASSTFKSNDDSESPGILYVLDNAHTMVSTSDNITLRALTAGLEGKLLDDDKLTSTAPIPLVDSLAVISSTVVAPLAAETTEQYRAVVLASYREEPQGGAATDYRLWASDAQGVALVYPYVKSAVQDEINLFVEAIIADSIDNKGTPSQALLDAVEGVIEFNPDTTLPTLERGRRPLGSFQINYLPVTIKTIDIVITNFVGPSTDIETAIFNAMKAQTDVTRPFVAAADIVENKNDIFDVNRIISIILGVRPGAIFTSVDLQIDSVSVSSYTFTDGNIPYLNTITYV